MGESLGSVERALEALLLFDAERREIGVTELARLLECSTSSAQRTINTLTKLQFLRRDDQRRVYRLGPGVLHLSRAWQSTASLASITRPVITRLASETGLTATFAIADHAHMRAVISVDGPEGPLREYPMAGELFPAHVGAISKAYFAHLPREHRDHYTSARPLARYTAETSMNPQDLEDEFAKIRSLGYCVTRGEYDELVSALAMPVRIGAEPLGSVAVATRENLPAAQLLLDPIRRAVRDIGQLLGKRH